MHVTLLGVLLAAAVTPQGAAYSRPPCELNKTRGGFEIFRGEAGGHQTRITILQCGDLPLERPNFELLRSQHYDAVPLSMQSIYLNAAYAALHGYKYEYFQVDANGTHGRGRQWCRIPAIRSVLQVCFNGERTV